VFKKKTGKVVAHKSSKETLQEKKLDHLKLMQLNREKRLKRSISVNNFRAQKYEELACRSLSDT